MFDLEKLGVGVWFPYQDSVVHKNLDGTVREIEWLACDEKNVERVCLRQPDPEKMRLVREQYKGKKTTFFAKDPDTRQMVAVPITEQNSEQEKEQSMAFWDEAIESWEIKTPKKELIPCTKENKYKLITMVPAFLRFCNDRLEKLSGIKIEAEKAAEKN